MQHSFLGMDDLKTEYSFMSQATLFIDALSFYWHVIHGCLYNQAPADVRLTGTGIKCLTAGNVNVRL